MTPERNLHAFLAVVRAGEGTSDPRGYHRLFGGEEVEDLSDHPRRRVTRTLRGAKELTSSAAGAYQALERTWDDFVRSVGPRDFSIASQDEFAVWCLKRRRALDDVLAGRFDTAINKCALEWASLPGSPYGQPTISLARARQIYTASGGQFEAQSVAPPPVEPAPPPVQPAPIPPLKRESAMAPITIAAMLAQAVATAVPALARAWGGKDASEVAKRNAKAVDIVAKTAVEALGAVNEQDALERLRTDPEGVAKVEQGLQEVWFTLTEAGGGGIEGARAFNTALAAGGDTPFYSLPAFWVTVLLLPLLYGTVWVVLTGAAESFSGELRAAIAAAVVSSVLGAITGFWLGSSLSSQRKDQALLRRAPGG